MKTDIYTITGNSIEKMANVLPDYVKQKANRNGCFILGAVVEENSIKKLVGMCQFFVNQTDKKTIIAELAYMYIYEGYRRKGIGLSLVDKMISITRKSMIGNNVTVIMKDEAESLGYGISAGDLEAFLNESGFVATKEDSSLWKVVERDMFAGIPDIIISGTKRYVRLGGR